MAGDPQPITWLTNGAFAAKPAGGKGTWTLFRKLRTTAPALAAPAALAASVPPAPTADPNSEAKPPLWPVAYTINSTEGYLSKARAPVSYAYDWTQRSERFFRPTTGLQAQDNVCQGVDAPCIDLVTGGYRYIIHPKTDDCCVLGTFAHGCGPVAQDWMVVGNGTYGGRAVVNGAETDEWTVQGNSVNKWYQTTDGAVPTRMDQGTFRNDYDRASFRTYASLPADFFTPPPACKAAPKCKSQVPCIYG